MTVSSHDDDTFVAHLRSSAPYIHAHRGRTFVVCFPGEAVSGEGFAAFLHDVAMLHGFGVRLVLVHGAAPQIRRRLDEAGRGLPQHGGRTILDAGGLSCVKEAVGALRVEIESVLSMGLPDSPMAGARLRVASGNFVVAQPVGVVDGVDYGYAGQVRRVDADGIVRRLDAGDIVLVSPLGYSLTGEIFDVDAQTVAGRVSTALAADKLVTLVTGPGLVDDEGHTQTELTPDEAAAALCGPGIDAALAGAINSSIDATRATVRRAHLLPLAVDGALLCELFTRDGIGTMITGEHYEEVRRAELSDVAGLLELLAPLEEDGVLLKRPRELLETDIDRFALVERDGLVVACAALYPFAGERSAEVACIAVDPRYRDAGRGEALLAYLEKRARSEGLQRLFALTTRATHWFVERGFVPGAVEDLPEARRERTRSDRRSKILVKSLAGRMAQASR